MRVLNPNEHGVFVRDHGLIPPGGEATITKNEVVKELLEEGVLHEARASTSSSAAPSSDQKKEGDS